MQLPKRTLLIITLLVTFFSFPICAQIPRFKPAYPNILPVYNSPNKWQMEHALFKFGNIRDEKTNKKYDFKVEMKDGTIKYFESFINSDTVAHTRYLLMVDKELKKNDPKREQKIYPSQTIQITRYLNEDSGTVITGFATDSCWLFKIISGRINAYSCFSEEDYMQTGLLRAIQVGDGPVQKLTPEILEPLIAGDDKAYKAFQKKDYYKAIEKFNSDHQ